MKMLRLKALELNAELEKFGKTRCKFHRNRTKKLNFIMECHHPAMR